MLFLLTAFIGSCSPNAADTVTEQRRAGEVRLPGGSSVQLTSGVFPSVSENLLIARSAAPVLRVLLRTGPAFGDALELEVRNVHHESLLRTVSIAGITDSVIDGCPREAESSINCDEAVAAVGEPCGDGCPDGTNCEEETCQPTGKLSLCTAPSISRDTETPTRFRFSLEGPPCTDLQFSVELEQQASSQPLRFAVLGSTDDLVTFRTLREPLRRADLDFIAVLGDHVTVDSPAGLDELKEELEFFDVAVVFVAGEDEAGISEGQAFLDQISPYDFNWDLKRVRFVTFFSAEGSLSESGLTRLDRTLSGLDRRAERFGDGPFVSFTHVPPLDTDSVRGQGFDSELEGARVISVLRDRGVDALFTGHLSASDHRDFEGLDVFITTAQDTAFADDREFLLVTVEDATDETSGRVIGDRSMTIETLSFP